MTAPPASSGLAPMTPAATIAPRWLRAAFLFAGLGAWFWTQSLIGQREFSGNGVGDVVHQWTAGLHDAFRAHPQAANTLLIISSAVIDVVGVSLLAATLFGRTVRPFLGLLMLFVLRQLCQMLCALPAPPEMIWHNTGVPTLLVTYAVSTDFFSPVTRGWLFWRPWNWPGPGASRLRLWGCRSSYLRR